MLFSFIIILPKEFDEMRLFFMSTAIDYINMDAQKQATNEILSRMEKYLNGTQLYELNKVLNDEFNKVTFTKKREDLHYDIESENRFVLNEFINMKRIEGLSKRTLDKYDYEIWKMFEYLGKHYNDITTDDIRQYLQYAQNINGASNRTIDNYRKSLNSFFNTMSDNGSIYKNPMTRISPIKYEKKVKKPFSDEEIEVMRLAIPEEDLLTRAIFEVLLCSGIRLGGLVNLNRNDLDFNSMTFKVTEKGNKERICYLNDAAKVHLKKYLKTRTDNNPALFVATHTRVNKQGVREPPRIMHNGIERRMRELSKKSGVENVHPHRFRRTVASKLIKRGMPIDQVQKVLGHDNISTTMLYVEVEQNAVKLNHQKYTN